MLNNKNITTVPNNNDSASSSSSSSSSTTTTTTTTTKRTSFNSSSLKNINMPWLYFGDKYMAKDIRNIKKHNIKYILNCTPTKREGGISNYYYKDNNIEYCRLPMQDNGTESLNIWYNTAWDFIEKCNIRQDGNLLIHCNWGQSRSVSIVISYLIKYYKYTYNKALEVIQNIRSESMPNESFTRQLIKLSDKLKDTKDYASPHASSSTIIIKDNKRKIIGPTIPQDRFVKRCK